MTMPLGWPPCASLPLHMLIHSRNHYPEIEVRPCRMCFFPCRRPFSIVDGRRTKESRMCDCLHLQMNYCPKVTVSLVSHICYYDFFALSFFLLSFFSQRPAGSCVVFFLFSQAIIGNAKLRLEMIKKSFETTEQLSNHLKFVVFLAL